MPMTNRPTTKLQITQTTPPAKPPRNTRPRFTLMEHLQVKLSTGIERRRRECTTKSRQVVNWGGRRGISDWGARSSGSESWGRESEFKQAGNFGLQIGAVCSTWNILHL